MAVQNRNTLKNYFLTGGQPSQSQFADLIDSLMPLQGGLTGIAAAVGLNNASVLLIADPATGNIYKSTLASVAAQLSTKYKTWIIKDTPTGNEKPSGNTLSDVLIQNITPADIMYINNLPLQWKQAGVTYDSNTGFDFTAYAPLQDDTVITIVYI